jgi:hypothetical protein
MFLALDSFIHSKSLIRQDSTAVGWSEQVARIVAHILTRDLL